MNHKTIFVILEDIAFCGFDPYKGYDAIVAYTDEYAKNKNSDDATTAAYRILRDDNYNPTHQNTTGFPQYKVETEMSDSLSAAILNGEMGEQ